MTLRDLARQHGTDKADVYTAFYELLLAPRRESIRRVLEIGVGHPECMKHVPGYRSGASLRMWRDYFPNAMVYGLDINPVTQFREERISTLLCDQRDARSVLWGMGATYDLIVDDGNHAPECQIETANTLRPFLTGGGIYIIEDVAKPLDVSTGLKFAHSVVVMSQGGRAIVFGDK